MKYAVSEEAQAAREANRKLLEKYFNEGSNPDMYDDEATMAQPFYFPGKVSLIKRPAPPAPKEGKEEAPPAFTIGWKWGEHHIYGTDDPDLFFVENAGSGQQLRGDGKYYPYHNEYVHVFRFRNGKIYEYREIANPVNLMDAMGVRYDRLPTPEDTMEELKQLAEKKA